MTHTTQCPDCQTCFKINPTQLAVASGLVRCGRCSRVFNAQDHLVQIEPPRLDKEHHTFAATPFTAHKAALKPDDFQLEVPDFDPKATDQPNDERNYAHTDFYNSTQSLQMEATEPQREEVEAFQRALKAALQQQPISHPFGESPQAEAILPHSSPPNEPEEDSKEEELYAIRPPEQPHTAWHRRWLTGLFVLLSMLALAALAGQLIFFNRAHIATRVPELRPALEQACQTLGCTVPLSTDLQFIRTEWSDCPQLPDHPNVLQLQAKIRNRAPYPQAWPMMELSLKDANNQLLIRKIFTPKEYLKTDDYKLGRFNANTEALIDILFDSGQVRPRGYSIYWFYP